MSKKATSNKSKNKFFDYDSFFKFYKERTRRDYDREPAPCYQVIVRSRPVFGNRNIEPYVKTISLRPQ